MRQRISYYDNIAFRGLRLGATTETTAIYHNNVFFDKTKRLV